MKPVRMSLYRGTGHIDVEPIYRRGVWAVVPYTAEDETTVDGAFLVAHEPTGTRASEPGLTLTADEALCWCRRLAESVGDDFAADAVPFGLVPASARAIMPAYYAFKDWLAQARAQPQEGAA